MTHTMFQVFPTAKINEVVTQFTSVLRKSRLFQKPSFILKLSAVGVIGACRGECQHLKKINSLT